MKLIFLNLDQKRILDESNVGVKSLTMDTLREYLTTSDYRGVLSNTATLLKRGNILSKFGFDSSATPTRSNGQPYVVDDGTGGDKNKIDDGLILKAACPDRDHMVIWEEPVIGFNTNDMFRQSLRNVLSAMSTVVLIEELKQTKQFELCLLN